MLYQLLTVSSAFAETSDTEIIYGVMRGIGIKYLISEDRKLPKKNREKWEDTLSDFVDFDALNSGMKERVRSAAGSGNENDIDNDTLIILEEKAVLFLVPRELSDYTNFYLREMDNVTKLPACIDGLKSEGNKVFLLCEKKLGKYEIRIKFLNNSEEKLSLLFRKTDRWRLSNIESVISERMLVTIARWK